MPKFNDNDVEDLETLLGKKSSISSEKMNEDDDMDKEVALDEMDQAKSGKMTIPQEITEQAEDLESQLPKTRMPASDPESLETDDFPEEADIASAPATKDSATSSSLVPQSLDDRLMKLQELMNQRRDQQQSLNALSAGNKIGQSLAGKYSGQFNPDTHITDSLQKQANQPVDDYLSLLKTYKAMQPKPAGASRRVPVTVEENGKNVTYLVDPITGDKMSIGVRGYAPSIVTDPRTKEKFGFRGGSSSTFGLTGPGQAITDLKKTGAPVSSQDVQATLNREQMDQVSKLKSQFASETKDSRDYTSQINGVLKDVDAATTNPNMAKSLGGIVAKLIESGRLTDEDAKRYTGRAGVLNQLKDSASLMATGTITQEQANAIKESLALMQKTAAGKNQDRAVEKAKAFSNSYKGYKPEDIAPLIYGDFQDPNEFVTMVSPKGERKRIRKSETQKYIDKGATVLNE